MAVLGLSCCEYFSLVAASGSYSLVVESGLLIVVASLVEHWALGAQVSAVVACRL